MTLAIRAATVEHAAEIAMIYAHHVLHGTATYETVPPTAEYFRSKIEVIGGRGWPFLVATDARGVAGYCYATQFRDRPAYAYACENSIYVRHDRVGMGIGKRLLLALVDESETYGFRQMVAVIGGAEPASIALHRLCGFVEMGRLPGMGWKAGRWLDSVYMQIALGGGTATPPSEPVRVARV
jgi:L-amino acid N-acyltransferase YncA